MRFLFIIIYRQFFIQINTFFIFYSQLMYNYYTYMSILIFYTKNINLY
jgi:hypothetical protein